MKIKKQFSIRFEPDVLRKFKYISQIEGRTVSGEIAHLVSRYVHSYEEEYGEVELAD